jgi:hypothetical protein
MNATMNPADYEALAHLGRIAATQKRIKDAEAELDVLTRARVAKHREMLGYVKELRDLVDQAAGLQAMALPFGDS